MICQYNSRGTSKSHVIVVANQQRSVNQSDNMENLSDMSYLYSRCTVYHPYVIQMSSICDPVSLLLGNSTRFWFTFAQTLEHFPDVKTGSSTPCEAFYVRDLIFLEISVGNPKLYGLDECFYGIWMDTANFWQISCSQPFGHCSESIFEGLFGTRFPLESRIRTFLQMTWRHGNDQNIQPHNILPSNVDLVLGGAEVLPNPCRPCQGYDRVRLCGEEAVVNVWPTMDPWSFGHHNSDREHERHRIQERTCAPTFWRM